MLAASSISEETISKAVVVKTNTRKYVVDAMWRMMRQELKMMTRG